ncbi:MAG: phosphoglycolate phosphatase [Thermoplasmata archaeon]|nr:phosphoglycolate phosphatase [Thermoplasmata archaeon]
MSDRISAIAIDIDGTLTDYSKKVSCAAIEALRRQVEKGVTVMLVTGNVLPIAYALRHYLGMNGPVIAENGGIVCQGETVISLSSKEEPQKAFDHLSKQMKVERIFSDRWRETEIAIRSDYDIELIKKQLVGFDVKVLTTGWAHHIMHKDTDKAVGLEYVCKNWLKIDLDRVAAIGDSDNDVKMIERAGFGITLANGSEKCKEKADFISPSPHGEGIIEALRWLGLEI